MFHPAAALHQPGLRTAIEHDFSLIPGYLEQAKERLEPKPVIEETPAKEEQKPAADSEPESGEAAQLSLF